MVLGLEKLHWKKNRYTKIEPSRETVANLSFPLTHKSSIISMRRKVSNRFTKWQATISRWDTWLALTVRIFVPSSLIGIIAASSHKACRSLPEYPIYNTIYLDEQKLVRESVDQGLVCVKNIFAMSMALATFIMSPSGISNWLKACNHYMNWPKE